MDTRTRKTSQDRYPLTGRARQLVKQDVLSDEDLYEELDSIEARHRATATTPARELAAWLMNLRHTLEQIEDSAHDVVKAVRDPKSALFGLLDAKRLWSIYTEIAALNGDLSALVVPVEGADPVAVARREAR